MGASFLDDRTSAVTAVFLTELPSLSLFVRIRSYNAALLALVGVSGTADDDLLTGVFGTGISLLEEVGVVVPLEGEGVYAAANFAAAFPKEGVRIPPLLQLGVNTPPLEPEEGVSVGRGPRGVTGSSSGTAGKGILNPSESLGPSSSSFLRGDTDWSDFIGLGS